MAVASAVELLDTFVFDHGQEAEAAMKRAEEVDEVNAESVDVQLLTQGEGKIVEYEGGLSHTFELDEESRRPADRHVSGQDARDDGLVDEHSSALKAGACFFVRQRAGEQRL